MAHTSKLGLSLGVSAGMALAITALTAHSVNAQMYSTGPGFYMSLEGRYLQNDSDKARVSPHPAIRDDAAISMRLRNDKDLVGKAGVGYRFENNWDIGVSASGMKSLR